MKMGRKLSAIWIVLACAALPAARGADSFYLGLFEQGTGDYLAGDYAAAVKKLRVACFGLLDEPELLAEGLVRLALAQDGLGDDDGVRRAYERLAEIENRFGAYTALQAPTTMRPQFERMLPRRIDEEALQRAPVFREILERKKASELAALAPARRRKELTRRLEQDPGDVEALIALTELDRSQGRLRQARKRVAKILARDPVHAGALCARGRLALASQDCEAALADLEACTDPPTEADLAAAYEVCRTMDDGPPVPLAAAGAAPATEENASAEAPVTFDGPTLSLSPEPEPEPEIPQPAATEPQPPATPPVDERPVDEPPVDEPAAAEPSTTPQATPPEAPTAETPDPAKVKAVVDAWARAWSEQRPDDYLSFYSAVFVPEEGLSREAWSELRRRRIEQPQHIEVDILILSTRLERNRASVTFLQDYRSDRFQDRVRKVLELRLEEDQWRIVRERAAP